MSSGLHAAPVQQRSQDGTLAFLDRVLIQALYLHAPKRTGCSLFSSTHLVWGKGGDMDCLCSLGCGCVLPQRDLACPSVNGLDLRAGSSLHPGGGEPWFTLVATDCWSSVSKLLIIFGLQVNTPHGCPTRSSLETLRSVSHDHLALRARVSGRHPSFGPVTLTLLLMLKSYHLASDRSESIFPLTPGGPIP